MNEMTLAAGTELGPYKIISPIGKGGMGEVYRARDTRLDREVAVKVLPSEVADDPQALRRFEREAKSLAALSHPNILSIHDVGRHDGVSYVVTELLEGETLRMALRNGPLNQEQCLSISIAIAEGLSAAHSKGVIHRDLKPENIFLTSAGPIKILDFGLAHRSFVGEDSGASQIETATQVIAGTVPYMSPEQAKGQSLDFRTDIFSFGCLLYEMLSGNRAFDGNSNAEVLAAILKEDPPPIPEIYTELQHILVRCLAKNPDQRYQSSRDLSSDLKLLVTGASFPTTFIPKKSNRRIQFALLFLLIAGTIAFILLRRPSTQVTSIAVLPFANVSGDSDTEYLSDGISETIINRLSQLSNLKVASRMSVFRYKGQEQDVKKISKELNVRAVLVGRVQQRGENISVSAELIDTENNSQIWGDQFNKKVSDVLEIQNSIAQEISENLKIKLTGSQRTKLAKQETTSPEAYQLYLKGRYHFYKFTEDGLTKSIPYYEQAIAKDPNFALAYSGLSASYSVLAINYWRPADAFPKAKAAAAKAIQLDDSVGSIHNILGVGHLFFDWDWPAAKREFDIAVELDPGLADPHNLLAYYWTVIGNPEQGIVELKRGLDLEPLKIVLNTDLAYAYTIVSRNDDAIHESRATLEIDPQYSTAYAVLGQAYLGKGMYAEAIAALEKAKSFEQNAEILGRLGNAYAVAGDTQKAGTVLNELLSLSSQKYIAPFGAAMIYTGLGEKDLALKWLEKSYQERNPWLIWLGADPVFIPLHKEHGFQQILKNMHVTAYQPHS